MSDIGMQQMQMQHQMHQQHMVQQQQQQVQQQQQQQQQLVQQQQQAQQQQQQQQRPQAQEDKLVAKAKEEVTKLKEKWSETLRAAALKVQLESDCQAVTGGSAEAAKFESHLEDFYAICDQIELNIRTAIDCLNQTASSTRYMPIPPNPRHLDASSNQQEFLSYPQYIATSKNQVQFANDVRQLLSQAARDVLDHNY